MIVVGYAKVPAMSTSRGAHEYFSVSLLIEPPAATVLAVESTATTAMTREWLSSLLLGAELGQDETAFLETVDRHYLGPATGTVKQAIRDAWRRYASLAQDVPTGTEHSRRTEP
jgi:Domain of unknown function (DUF3870)